MYLVTFISYIFNYSMYLKNYFLFINVIRENNYYFNYIFCSKSLVAKFMLKK